MNVSLIKQVGQVAVLGLTYAASMVTGFWLAEKGLRKIDELAARRQEKNAAKAQAKAA